MNNNLNKEGTIKLDLTHPDQDWGTNNREYKWSGTGQVSYQAAKHSDGTLDVIVNIPAANRDFILKFPAPETPKGLAQLIIVWKDKEINIYLNGKLAQTLKE